MKKDLNQKKLTFKKIKITKPSQLKTIKGGNLEDDCRYPDNGSKPKDSIIKI